jgi:hypothetical protein
VIVAEGGARVRDGLEPVYRALGLEWDPATVGAVEEEAPDTGMWTAVRDALLAEYAERYELVDTELDAGTLALARELAPDHRPPAVSAIASTIWGQT